MSRSSDGVSGVRVPLVTPEQAEKMLDAAERLMASVTAANPDVLAANEARGDLQEAVAPLKRAMAALARTKQGATGYPHNPYSAAMHRHLQRHYGPAINGGYRWNNALTFIADHMPTTPETFAAVMQDAADKGLVSRIPGVGAANYRRLQEEVVEFFGSYDNSNSGESVGQFNLFMRGHYGNT